MCAFLCARVSPPQILARDCQRVQPLSQIYFILFNDLIKSIFLNLYLATIIDKLDGAVSQSHRLFKEDFEHFETVRGHTHTHTNATDQPC